MPTLHEGDAAPDFSLPSSTGETISLSDLRGKNVVLYFYPNDDTPGCTKEACSFRDNYDGLMSVDAVVLGVSANDLTSHGKFTAKYNLPFPLLADTDHRVSEAYGTWVQKGMFGRTSMGMQRDTFLIGPDGTIKRIWHKVKPDDHAHDVLNAIRRETSAA